MGKRFLASLLILTAAVAACSKDDGNISSNNAPARAPAPSVPGPSAPQQPTESAPAAGLQALWESTCRDSDLLGLSESARLELADGGTVTRVTRYFVDGGCSTQAVEFNLTGTYAQGDQQASGATNIDFTVNAVTVKPVTQRGVDILRLANFCGIADWSVGVAKDVTSASGGDRCLPKLPQTIYEIYAMEGDKLYFGKSDDAATDPAKRPTELNREFVYSRR